MAKELVGTNTHGCRTVQLMGYPQTAANIYGPWQSFILQVGSLSCLKQTCKVFADLGLEHLLYDAKVFFSGLPWDLLDSLEIWNH